MATAWQTVEEAALTLGISSRTLHRRLVKGEFQTRLENGRREVLVTIAEPVLSEASATPSDNPPAASETASVVSDASDSALPAQIHHAVLALHEDRVRRTDLAIMAYQQSVNVTAAQARRATVQARFAWGTAGAMAIALSLTAIWTVHRVTRAQAEVDHLGAQVKQLTDTADTRTRETDKLRADAETARLAAARAEGELIATKLQLDKAPSPVAVATPATQPTTAPLSDTPKADRPLSDNAVRHAQVHEMFSFEPSYTAAATTLPSDKSEADSARD